LRENGFALIEPELIVASALANGWTSMHTFCAVMPHPKRLHTMASLADLAHANPGHWCMFLNR
jgi:hypothetical protein